MIRAINIVLMIGLLAGCGSTRRDPPKRIDLKDVPESIMKIAKDKLPDVQFDNALLKSNGTFEVRGKNKVGKLREIDIRPDGTIEEIE
ncbi:MAG: hypothetical protein KJS91_06600 [Planctomycetes bacterium]|nr:hypothetical protein [Planctomycetota bacterium]